METKNNEQIIEQITDYILHASYNYAIMINGEWGSGKTYFIKNKLVNMLNENKAINKKCIYISLYGLKTRDELSSAITNSIIEERVGDGKKLLPFINFGTNVIIDIVGSKLDSETIKKLDKKILSPFISFDKYYFVFDDLERSSLPINEVLGYINNFVEQNNAKVIVVANEKEIGSVDNYDRKYENYLLATNANIDWPEMPENSISKIFSKELYSGNEGDTVSLETIKYRLQHLIGENDFYYQVKEKLIGQTLYYKPNIKKIIPILFKDYFEKESVEAKIIYTQHICDILKKEEYFNLRTLQFVADFLSKVARECDLQLIEEDIGIKFNNELIKSILMVTIHYKSGGINYNWAEEIEYGNIFLDGKSGLDNYFMSFKFVDEYIYRGTYNNVKIIKVLESFKDDLIFEKRTTNDPINILRNYYVLEDDVIERNLKLLYKNIEKSKYDGKEYRSILSLLYALKPTGMLNISIDEVIDIMKERVSKGESIKTMGEPFTIEHKYSEEYTKITKELIDIEEKLSKKEEILKLNSIFDKDGWGKLFHDYCYENRNKINVKNGFFDDIDLEKCIEAINLGTVYDICEFKWAIMSMYENAHEIHDSDIKKLHDLKCSLKKPFKGKMKEYNRVLLVDILDEIINFNEEIE